MFSEFISKGSERINRGNRLIFHTDVMPSESINHSNEDLSLALICVVCGNPGLIGEEFSQFKKTRGNERKVRAAKRLREIINNGKADIRLLTSFARIKELKVMGLGLLESLSRMGVDLKIENDEYIFGAKKISSRIALICPWYMFSLISFASFAAQMCSSMSYPGFAFALDPLPGDDIVNGRVVGLEFLTFIFQNSPLKERWKEVIGSLEIEYSGFGYLGIPGNSVEGNVAPAKNIGEAILADWLSQSVHAALNHEWYVDIDPGRTEDFRKEIAAICFDLKAIGNWVHIPVKERIMHSALGGK